MKTEYAFSGLEAAIVLIAFVVVAAVFSYVMLGAGFFATQKSQEVTYSGVKQSTSNLIIDGQIYGSDHNDVASTVLKRVKFNIGIPEGGQAQNLKELTFVITSSANPVPNPIKWVASPGTNPQVDFYQKDGVNKVSSYILKPGEKAQVYLDMFTTTGTSGLIGGQSFTIEIKPLTGAATLITKSLSTGYKGGLIY